MSKSWKVLERRLAADVGTERIPVTGRQRDLGGSDFEDAMFCYSAKLGYKQPKRLRQWMHDIETFALQQGKVPVIVWKAKFAPDDEALVITTWKHFKDLHG